MFKTALLAAAAVVAAAASPAYAATNFVQNGNFSTVSSTSSTGNFQLTSGNTYGSVSGWSTSGGYNLLYNGNNATTVAGNAYGDWTSTNREYLWSLTDGAAHGNFLALDGDQSLTRAVSQTITGLTVGQTYNLSFDWGAGQIASRNGATTEQLQVSFGSDVFNTAVLSNADKGFTGWNTVTTSFKATSTTQVLSFLSKGTPTGLPPVALLDNVSMTAAVPEPATWAMMLVGFGMVGAASRYRRRNTAATFA